MRQIGVAVVGCGVNHARVYAGLDKAKLIKIADTDPERRRLAEKRFDAECYADLRDIYRDEEVETVSICTPTVTHAWLARDALQAGKHMLIEALRAENIECGVYYPSPLMRHPILGDGSTCTNAEELSRSVLSLPIHPFLGEREIEAMAKALGKVVSHFLR